MGGADAADGFLSGLPEGYGTMAGVGGSSKSAVSRPLPRAPGGWISVMTLPNTVHLHLGSAESVPVGQMRKAVKVAAAGPLRSREGFILSVSASGDLESVKAALRVAGKDPAAPVRQGTELYAARLAAQGVVP